MQRPSPRSLLVVLLLRSAGWLWLWGVPGCLPAGNGSDGAFPFRQTKYVCSVACAHLNSELRCGLDVYIQRMAPPMPKPEEVSICNCKVGVGPGSARCAIDVTLTGIRRVAGWVCTGPGPHV